MAQMPASYLTEKVDDLRAHLVTIDKTSGLIELSDHSLRHLTEMIHDARAIASEITEWTGIEVDA